MMQEADFRRPMAMEMRYAMRLDCTYDALNRMTTCVETKSGVSQGTSTFSYDRNGNVVLRSLPDGSSTKTSRDILGRTKIIETKAPSGASTTYTPQYFTFTYDRVGNVRKIVETYSGTGSVSNRTITNKYDRTYRLDIETAGSVVTNYDYDLANNRIKKTVGTQTTDYFYQTINTSWGITTTLNKTNRISHYDVKNSGTLASRVKFRYNNNGNRIAARAENGSGVVQGTSSYTFDREDRLAVLSNGIAPNTGTYTYTYDYRTRRVKKQEPSRTVTSVFSGGTSVQEYEGTTLKAEYVRGSDWGGGVGGILYSVRPSIGRVNYHYNGRGDVTTKTKKNGSAADIAYQASYEAYGTRTQQSGTDADPQKANTKDEDPTGLLNEGFRYRDLVTGSFITRDPAGFVDGPNLYTYVKQNPWSAFDPEGLFLGYLVEKFEQNFAEPVAAFADKHITSRIPDTMLHSMDGALAGAEKISRGVAGTSKFALNTLSPGEEVVRAVADGRYGDIASSAVEDVALKKFKAIGKIGEKAKDSANIADSAQNTKEATEKLATTMDDWKGPADYSDIVDHPSVAPGKSFTQSQKKKIF